ncbi:hypothetical protein Q4I32_002324 [Leishmania shawi]|uniref:Uncharacterized protein n=1 Tax=Leishmania shawi TaxID=5680 RepID=A0AAW3C389_9TRYP
MRCLARSPARAPQPAGAPTACAILSDGAEECAMALAAVTAAAPAAEHPAYHNGALARRSAAQALCEWNTRLSATREPGQLSFHLLEESWGTTEAGEEGKQPVDPSLALDGGREAGLSERVVRLPGQTPRCPRGGVAKVVRHIKSPCVGTRGPPQPPPAHEPGGWIRLVDLTRAPNGG